MRKPLLLLASALMATAAANAAPHGIKVGVLTCTIEPGWGYVLGSAKNLHCRYHPNHGIDDSYTGRISKFGLDIGYTSSTTLVWDVIAPSSDIRAGALEGGYAGATASATIAIGAGANVLLGGFDKSIALQPVSVESQSGFALAAGIGALRLKKAPPASPVAMDVPDAPDNRYALWFDFDDDQLTPSGRMMVAKAARDAKASGASRIHIVGHADRVGGDGYNMDLSLRRAETVRREMVRNGFDESRIVIDGRGDRNLAVPTADGVREPENRRVVISWSRDKSWRQASR